MITNQQAPATTRVLSERGWTDSLIKQFLGEPDGRRAHGRYHSTMIRLYDLRRVEAAEQTAAFADARAKAERRRAAGKKGAETRHKIEAERPERLMDEARSISTEVKLVPPDVVRLKAVQHYEVHVGREPVTPDAAQSFLDRITVNYIRHVLTDYDDHLTHLELWGGDWRHAACIRERIFEAIAEAYPRLAEECHRQMAERP